MLLKKLSFYSLYFFIILFVTAVALELLSLPAIYISSGEWVSASQIQETLKEKKTFPHKKDILAKEVPDRWIKEYILHPYLGFVRNYRAGLHKLAGRTVTVPVNEYGFFGAGPPLEKNEKSISVAIMGGSLAAEFFLYGREIFEEELAKIPAFSGKKINLYSIALGGMKQPQQVLALNYFMSLGARFDMVINIDGFNEMALPQNENIPFGVFPYYPRLWRSYASKAMDIESAVLMAGIYREKARNEEWRRFFSKRPFNISNFFLALWHVAETNSKRKIATLEKEFNKRLREKGTEELSPQEAGPPYKFGSFMDIFNDAAGFWGRSSRQMWDLCKGEDILYFHFLQPNQYVPHSKKLTEEEMKVAYIGVNENDMLSYYRMGVEYGYPLLQMEGQKMSQTGLPFFDLTGAFKNVDKSVYRDRCCHLNDFGYNLLARDIAALIGENAH
ncbi:MAG: hypothetical protein OEV42_14115 [Deltaproteobacteria bacterium]|nr:hypothetical protein [Deltaproteobacteria bacterium]